MLFAKDERGAILLLEKKESNLYELVRSLTDQDVDVSRKTEISRLIISALGSAGIVDFDAHGMKVVVDVSRKGTIFAAIPAADAHMSKEEVSELADEMLKEADAKNMEEFDDSEMAAACLFCLDMMPQIESFVKKYVKENILDCMEREEESDKPQYIYEIPIRDMGKLRKYADCFFNRRNTMYIKAKPGVILDDFYERVHIKENEYRRIDCNRYDCIG